MKINVPIIPRQKIVRSILKYGNPATDNSIYQDIQSYIRETFDMSNVYDIANPYIIRSAIIDAGDKTKGIKHYLVLDESGYRWEDEYTDELANELYTRFASDVSDAHYTLDEQREIKSTANTILFKDFGYDEFFEHIDTTIFHRVKSSSHKATLKMFYKVYQNVYSELFLNKPKNVEIDDERLAVYLAHLIITYITEWDLDDTICYEYEIPKDNYTELMRSNLSSYLMTLYHDFDKDEYTDAMKYTIACLIIIGYVFVINGFMKMNLDG